MEAVETEGNHAERHGHGPRGSHGINAAHTVEGQTGRARAPGAVAWKKIARRRLRGLMPTIDEFFGTSNQVCGGFWPFGTDMALPAEGVPVGRSLMTGAGVCCDPISWFKAGIIKQPSMFLLGLPAIGKSTFVRREVLGLSALGMNAIIPGDLKPDYASLVNMLGGQVIRLGAGIGVVNPLDPGDLHYALQRLEGEARKDLTDYYNDTRAALMEVLLTIMRTGREADDVGGARGVTARESDILSVAVRVLHDRHGGDPQLPSSRTCETC